MADVDLLSSHFRDDRDKLIDRYILWAANIDRALQVGLHETVNAVHHVVHIGIGTDSRTIPPDFNGAAILHFSDLPTDGCRRLFASAAPCSFRPIAVLEAGDAHLDSLIAGVGHRHPLGIQFFPAIFIVRVSRDGIRLDHFGLPRIHIPVHTDRRGEEITRHTQLSHRVGHVDVDQRTVVHDLAFGGVDEAHPAHVGCQLVDLIERSIAYFQCPDAVLLPAQIKLDEFICFAWMKLMKLDVHPAHPIPFPLEALYQMTTDKSACPAHQCLFQCHSPLIANSNLKISSVTCQARSRSLAKEQINERSGIIACQTLCRSNGWVVFKRMPYAKCTLAAGHPLVMPLSGTIVQPQTYLYNTAWIWGSLMLFLSNHMKPVSMVLGSCSPLAALTAASTHL